MTAHSPDAFFRLCRAERSISHACSRTVDPRQLDRGVQAAPATHARPARADFAWLRAERAPVPSCGGGERADRSRTARPRRRAGVHRLDEPAGVSCHVADPGYPPTLAVPLP